MSSSNYRPRRTRKVKEDPAFHYGSLIEQPNRKRPIPVKVQDSLDCCQKVSTKKSKIVILRNAAQLENLSMPSYKKRPSLVSPFKDGVKVIGQVLKKSLNVMYTGSPSKNLSVPSRIMSQREISLHSKLDKVIRASEEIRKEIPIEDNNGLTASSFDITNNKSGSTSAAILIEKSTPYTALKPPTATSKSCLSNMNVSSINLVLDSIVDDKGTSCYKEQSPKKVHEMNSQTPGSQDSFLKTFGLVHKNKLKTQSNGRSHQLHRSPGGKLRRHVPRKVHRDWIMGYSTTVRSKSPAVSDLKKVMLKEDNKIVVLPRKMLNLYKEHCEDKMPLVKMSKIALERKKREKLSNQKVISTGKDLACYETLEDSSDFSDSSSEESVVLDSPMDNKITAYKINTDFISTNKNIPSFTEISIGSVQMRIRPLESAKDPQVSSMVETIALPVSPAVKTGLKNHPTIRQWLGKMVNNYDTVFKCDETLSDEEEAINESQHLLPKSRCGFEEEVDKSSEADNVNNPLDDSHSEHDDDSDSVIFEKSILQDDKTLEDKSLLKGEEKELSEEEIKTYATQKYPSAKVVKIYKIKLNNKTYQYELQSKGTTQEPSHPKQDPVTSPVPNATVKTIKLEDDDSLSVIDENSYYIHDYWQPLHESEEEVAATVACGVKKSFKKNVEEQCYVSNLIPSTNQREEDALIEDINECVDSENDLIKSSTTIEIMRDTSEVKNTSTTDDDISDYPNNSIRMIQDKNTATNDKAMQIDEVDSTGNFKWTRIKSEPSTEPSHSYDCTEEFSAHCTVHEINNLPATENSSSGTFLPVVNVEKERPVVYLKHRTNIHGIPVFKVDPELMKYKLVRLQKISQGDGTANDQHTAPECRIPHMCKLCHVNDHSYHKQGQMFGSSRPLACIHSLKPCEHYRYKNAVHVSLHANSKSKFGL